MSSFSNPSSTRTHQFAYVWDYVIVFSMIETGEKREDGTKICKQTQASKGIIETLQHRGVRTFTYLSVQKDELYCMIQVDSKSLCHFADKINFQMELDPDRLEAFFTGYESSKASDDDDAPLLDKSTGRSVKNAAKRDIKLAHDHPLVEFRLRYGINERTISDGSELKEMYNIDPPSEYGPFDLIFVPYEKEIPQQFYLHNRLSIPGGKDESEGKINEWEKKPSDEPKGKLFSPLQRLKLIYYYLKCSNHDGGCGIQIDKFLRPPSKPRHSEQATEVLKGPVMKAFFPLHDRDIAQQLTKQSIHLSTTPWKQPFRDLRDYFGEKIALFYVFIGHYSMWLLIPSLVGAMFQLVVLASGDYSHPVLCFFGILVSSW